MQRTSGGCVRDDIRSHHIAFKAGLIDSRRKQYIEDTVTTNTKQKQYSNYSSQHRKIGARGGAIC